MVALRADGPGFGLIENFYESVCACHVVCVKVLAFNQSCDIAN
jgi:hypothetical protein